MKTNSLGLRIGLGYALMMVMLALAIGITIWQVDKIIVTSGRIKDLRSPTTQSSQTMLNGTNRSLAALRGWMILGQEEFKQERAKAWNDEIDASLEAMKGLSASWPNPQNVARLKKLENELNDFRLRQQEVEDIAQTPGNTPALRILIEQAAPRGKLMADAITEMIDLEKAEDPSPERKRLLGMMADFRGSTGLGLAAIRAYLLSGDEKFKKEFDRLWDVNTARFAELSADQRLMTPQQARAFRRLAEARSRFEPLPAEMFEIRAGDQWNLANHWLGTKAAPKAAAITGILEAMISRQQQAMADDFARNETQVNALRAIEWLLLAIGLVACALLTFFFTRSVTKQTAAMQESEAKTRAIVDTARDGMVTIDEKGIVQSFNHAAERQFGYSAEEVIGQNVKMLVPAPFKQEHDGYIKKYLTTNIAKMIGIGREVTGVRKDQSTFDMHLSVGEVVQNADRRLFTGIIRDITEEKRATNALEQSNQTMERENWLKSQIAHLTGLSQGVQKVEVLAQSLISELATTLEAGHGVFYSLEQAKTEGEENTLTLLGSYAYKERKNVANSFKIGEGLVGQCALEKKPIRLTQVPSDYIQINSGLGENSPLNIIAVPVVFEGAVMAVIELASFHEFTPVQQELVEQASATLGVVIDSIRGRQRTEELLVKTQTLAEETQAQSEELQASNEELEEKTNALQEQKQELQTANEELEEKSERLSQQSEELQASNEELEEKTEALEQQKSNIERKNSEIEIASQELTEKAADLQLASKYKSEFLANMSHELRTPLNSLLILSKDLADNEDGNLTGEQVECADIIHGGGQDLLRLINDILDLSKVEAGKMDLHVGDVEINSIVDAIRRQFDPIAAAKGLELRFETTDDLRPTLRTDGQRTEQILKNLLSNAFKFTSSGSVTLSIHRPGADVHFKDSDLTPQSAVALSVIDTGVGIPPEKQRAIFEAFQQADGSTSRDFGGTGLGLAISREMAWLLGGEIQLKSQVGQGSTFTLYLPLVCESKSPEPSKRQPEISGSLAVPKTESPKPAAAASEANGTADTSAVLEFVPDDRRALGENDRSLLIIEDDREFAEILMSLSRKKGYKCLAAGTGRDGLRLAHEYKPDVILLDLGLPDIDGLDVLDRLKQTRETRHIPVHVISARDQQWEVLHRGAFGYLAKPATSDDINAALKKVQNLLHSESKRVLVVEDDPATHRAIRDLFKNQEVGITKARNAKRALEQLRSQTFDCVILDLNLGDMTGFELLRRASEDENIEMPPVVVYTGRELTSEEHRELSQHTLSIVVKGVNSPERLLDEVSLFLHSVESNLPADQRQVTRMLHDSAEVFKGKKVLLVDDDMRNTFALSKVLRQHGLDVVLADNGRMALEKLEEDPEIDLVLMDIMMPVMDGYEATRRIREQDRFSNLPVVALTAKAMREDREKCLQAGASDYLIKPVSTDELLSLIKVWLFGQKRLVH